MPEENKTFDLQRTLDLLEDPMMNKPLAKSQYYKAFLTTLDSEAEISTAIVDRILAVCVQDLENDKSVIHVIRIIQSILKRIKAGGFPDLPNLLASVLAVLKIIKTSALMSKMETMQTLCFEILLSYPNETLIEIATLHTSEVMEVLNLYCHRMIPLEIRVLPCGLILKLLKILPPEKKLVFVKDNLSIWFSKVIPTAVTSVSTALTDDHISLKSMETLEKLTSELVPIEYAENPQWLELLECIYNPQKYPDMMRKMLSNGNNKWHRLWIVFIKLLKHQVTKTTLSSASPINSMLPVVEQAFKMNVSNRCRAFQCWNVLIENFRTESNEAYIVKRLKLLIIPLKSNNAKVEETAIAKLKTWWHLIICYQTKLEVFVDKVLISFLHFCFGRHVGMSPKSTCIPGLLTVNTKKQSVEAFVELAGHLACSNCVNVPKLSTKILTKQILVNHWNDFVYSLKMTIMIFSEDVGVTIQQVECLWKSFLLIIADLPDNSIRKDLFNELLNVLDNFEKQPEINHNLSNIIFHLLCSLLSEQKINVLLKPRDEKGPMYKIMLLLLSPSLNVFYRRSEPSDVVNKLKPLAKLLLQSNVVKPLVLKCPVQQNIAFLLTALAESIYESEYEPGPEFLWDFILWPLEPANFFIETDFSTKAWISLLNYMYPKLKFKTKDKLRAALSRDIASNMSLKLNLCIHILKHELQNDSVAGCTKTLELLMTIINSTEDHVYIKHNLSKFTDTVISLIEKIRACDLSSSLLEKTIIILQKLLKCMIPVVEETNDTEQYEILLQNVDIVLQYDNSTVIIIAEELMNCATKLQKYPKLQQCVVNSMKIFLSKTKDTESPLVNEIKAIIHGFESIPNKEKQQLSDDFAAPKVTTKKVKKKETTIVNTVVENGEEYEVIKSNWKFNPRKLTENQKEKLQRKREDIPALYQDLSQSQDEFKLSTWKTESQDASSTNSKSNTNSKSETSENVSEILKNIPSSDVVPKIIENIFSVKKEADIKADEKSTTETTKKLKQTTIRDPKSPRLALKDRVFRNVRNLIEKSSVQKDTKDLSESLIQLDNAPKTPTTKTVDNSHLVNTAPPVLGPERPSRLKRKPKKFDDVQLISLKRSRRSSCQNDSQFDSQDSNEKTYEPDSTTTSMNVENPLVTPPKDEANVTNEESVKIIQEKETSKKEMTTEKSTKSEVIDIKDDSLNTTKASQDPVPVPSIPNNQEKEKEGANNESSGIQSLQLTKTPEPATLTNDKYVIPDKEETPLVEPTLNDKDISIECTPQEMCVAKTKSDDEKLTPDKEPSTERVAEETSKISSVTEVEKTKNIKNNSKNIKTPKQSKTQSQEIVLEPRSGKRNSARKSRIEKELAIDTVEGHPFLKIQTEKRITRKNLSSPLNNSRRKSLTDKLSKAKTPLKTQASCSKKKEKELSPSQSDTTTVTVDESQDKCSQNTEDLPFSEDVIESSQDSTFTTISVKTSKPAYKQLSVVVSKVPLVPSVDSDEQTSQALLIFDKTMNVDTRDDSELPRNKTADIDKTDLDLTENMDTEPVDNKVIESIQNSSEVIIVNDVEEPIVISSETQEIADADTQPTSSMSETQEIAEADTQPSPSDISEIILASKPKSKISILEDEVQINSITNTTAEEITKTINDSTDFPTNDDDDTVSSPFKDEEQRKKDFLDNTLEISPIKTMSPIRDKKSPSPETSSDYVLIKLSSPVQSNGEPFEKCDSPEIFTEDKLSPDKRNLSPPREDTAVTSTSPSSSLSLKKNRPQVRSGGRAAQMLGLCVPDRLQTIMNSERIETEEPKKSSPSSTPARRNLRILYNSVGADSSENSEENEESENFLKFKRALPTSDCSPSGPILKRKLAEITDEATVSPASKRKRVSFHDPPVSTTVSVQKYIEPCGVRSPQNSLHKRQERQNLRSQTVLKSPKRLDNVFKLDTVLTKAVESFAEADQTSNDITQSISLDETPAVEIVKTSDLNDVDPICPELVDCKDLIDVIATELSSATMKTMFLKEIEGKIATVGDLAKMTELEVNRLCIKAPKIMVAKKVLNDYAVKKIAEKEVEEFENIEILDEEILAKECIVVEKADVEVQAKVMSNNAEMQTVSTCTNVCGVQTDETMTLTVHVQTNESGAKSTKEVISTCLDERPDFVEKLGELLDEPSKQRIAKTLPEPTITQLFMSNVKNYHSRGLITNILQRQDESNEDRNNKLQFLQNYMLDRFENTDLILFCSQMLAKIHEKKS